jgi:hypothetical protein
MMPVEKEWVTHIHACMLDLVAARVRRKKQAR